MFDAMGFSVRGPASAKELNAFRRRNKAELQAFLRAIVNLSSSSGLRCRGLQAPAAPSQTPEVVLAVKEIQ